VGTGDIDYDKLATKIGEHVTAAVTKQPIYVTVDGQVLGRVSRANLLRDQYGSVPLWTR
jgi:hypothetical protein